jgi:hypothetical protein
VALASAAYYASIGGWSASREAVAAAAPADLSLETRAEWRAYVDRRLAATMRRGDAGLTVRADIDGFIGNTTDIPFGTTFGVSCPRLFGGVVHFDVDGGRVTSSIFGATVVEPAEPPPSIGVSLGSPAALKLQRSLCRQISDAVHAAIDR